MCLCQCIAGSGRVQPLLALPSKFFEVKRGKRGPTFVGHAAQRSTCAVKPKSTVSPDSRGWDKAPVMAKTLTVPRRQMMPRACLTARAPIVARRLLDHWLACRQPDGQWAAGQIVEVEAYRQSDPACHAYRGKTRSNACLFGPPGHAYVYRSYGIHWCVNVCCEEEGVGAAVLIRALMPLQGLSAMQARRGPHVAHAAQLCRGPGNVCQALGIDARHDGTDLLAADASLQLWQGQPVAARDVLRGPRIGIRKAVQVPWRWWMRGESCVSGRKTAVTANRSL